MRKMLLDGEYHVVFTEEEFQEFQEDFEWLKDALLKMGATQ